MASSFWSGEFYFDDEHSNTHKVCIVDFNNNEILKQIGGGFTLSTEKDVSYNSRPFYMEKERTLENIVLQLCKTDKKPWSIVDIMDVTGWLFKKNFKKFQPTDFSNQGYDVVYYLKAIDMKKFLNPNMEGYLEVTFQSYDGYAYMISNNPITLSANETKVVTNMSNVNNIYYPKIRIVNHGNANSTITIINNTNGKSLEILGINGGEIITIDCAIGSVVNSNGDNRFGILKNYDFIGLEKGRNTISLNGNATIEFICEFPVLM